MEQQAIMSQILTQIEEEKGIKQLVNKICPTSAPIKRPAINFNNPDDNNKNDYLEYDIKKNKETNGFNFVHNYDQPKNLFEILQI